MRLIPTVRYLLRTGCVDGTKCSCADMQAAAQGSGPWTSVDSVMDVKVKWPAHNTQLRTVILLFLKVNTFYPFIPYPARDTLFHVTSCMM